jgi:hypothetical protein
VRSSLAVLAPGFWAGRVVIARGLAAMAGTVIRWRSIRDLRIRALAIVMANLRAVKTDVALTGCRTVRACSLVA